LQSTRIIFGAAIAVAVATFVACSDPSSASSPSGGGGSSSSSSSSSGSSTGDDGGNDASATTDALAPTGKTSVSAKIGGVTRTLVRAQFGTETDDAGEPLAHVEAHLGGDPACPSSDPDAAPTTQPDYTLVVGTIPRGNPGDVFTKADGVTAAYFDFKGDQLTSAPLTKASQVKVTIVASDTSNFEIEIDATFAEGAATGRIAAAYCPSLSL
jgi:hypothetical protein